MAGGALRSSNPRPGRVAAGGGSRTRLTVSLGAAGPWPLHRLPPENHPLTAPPGRAPPQAHPQARLAPHPLPRPAPGHPPARQTSSRPRAWHRRSPTWGSPPRPRPRTRGPGSHPGQCKWVGGGVGLAGRGGRARDGCALTTWPACSPTAHPPRGPPPAAPLTPPPIFCLAVALWVALDVGKVGGGRHTKRLPLFVAVRAPKCGVQSGPRRPQAAGQGHGLG